MDDNSREVSIYLDDIEKKNNEKKRNSMTGEELAILYGEQMEEDELRRYRRGRTGQTEHVRMVGSGMDTKANNAGRFRNFLGFMQLWKKMSFQINGTTFSGRKGYQIQGHPVPISQGTVIDFTPTTLMGNKGDEPGATMNRISKDPQLVYYSRQSGVVVRQAIPVKKNEVKLSENKIEMASDQTGGNFHLDVTDTLYIESSDYTVNEKGIVFNRALLHRDKPEESFVKSLEYAALTPQGVEISVSDGGGMFKLSEDELVAVDREQSEAEGNGAAGEGSREENSAQDSNQSTEQSAEQSAEQSTEQSAEQSSEQNSNRSTGENASGSGQQSTEQSQQSTENTGGERTGEGDEYALAEFFEMVERQQSENPGGTQNGPGENDSNEIIDIGWLFETEEDQEEIKPTLANAGYDGNKLAETVVAAYHKLEHFNTMVEAASGQFTEEDWEKFQEDNPKEALVLSMFPQAVDSLPMGLRVKREITLFVIKNAPLILSLVPDILGLIGQAVKLSLKVIASTASFAWEHKKEIAKTAYDIAMNPELVDQFETWNYIRAFITGETVTKEGDKLDYAKEALLQFLDDGTVPEVTPERLKKWGMDDEGEKEEDNSPFKDYSCRIVIVPGLNAVIGVEPHFSIGKKFDYHIFKSSETPSFEDLVRKGTDAFLSEGGEAVKNGEKAEEKKTDDKQKKALTAAKKEVLGSIKMNSDVSIAATGEIGTKVHAGLEVGAGMVFSVSGEVYGDLSILGGMDDKAFAKASLEKEIDFADFPYRLLNGTDTKLELMGSLKLDGTVGSDGKIGSELFGLEKELWDVVFGSWTLLSLEAKFEANWKAGTRLRDIELGRSINARSIHSNIRNIKDGEYGFSFKEKDKEFAELLKKGDDEAKARQELDKKYEALTAKNPDEMELKEIQELYDGYISHYVSEKGYSNQMDRMWRTHLNDTDFKKEETRLSGKVKKHEDNIAKLTEYMEKAENSGDTAALEDAAVMKYYTDELGSGGGYKKSVSKKAKEAAQSGVGTKDAILRYEEKRLEEKAKKHTEILKNLAEYMSRHTDVDPDKPNPGFVKYYLYQTENAKEFDPVEKEGFLNHISAYVSVGSMLKYEKERMEGLTKDSDKRLKTMDEKWDKLSGGTGAMLDKEKKFAEFYLDKISDAEDIFVDGFKYGVFNIEHLIEYEEKQLLSDSDTANTFMVLKNLQRKQDENEGKELTAQEKEALNEYARMQLRDLGGFKDNDIQKNAYLYATPRELLDYEKYRLDVKIKKAMKFSGDKNDSYNQMRRLEWKNSYSQYFISNSARINIFKENVEPATILSYEIMREEDTKKSGNAKKHEKHAERVRWLKFRIEAAKKMERDEDRDALNAETRQMYFSGQTDVESEAYYSDAMKSNDATENRGFIKAYSGRELEFTDKDGKTYYWDKSTEEAIKEELGKLAGAKHHERIKMLEEEVKKGSSMYEVWLKYKNMGGGDGFKKWVNSVTKEKDRDKENNEPIKRERKLSAMTFEDVMAFATEKVRRDSRANIFKRKGRKVLNKVKGFTPFVDSENSDSLEEMNRGGRLLRLERLRELSKGITLKMGRMSKEDGQKVINLYYKTLHAGSGFEEYVKKYRMDLLSKEALRRYEQGRREEDGKHYTQRIKYLEGRNANERTGKEYRDLIVGDGDSKWKKFKFSVVHNALTGFEQEAHEEAYSHSFGILNRVRPSDILAYEKDRITEKTAKHSERYEGLKKDEVTDANAMQTYREMGGGGRFLSQNKKQWKSDYKQRSKSYTADTILAYEKDSREKYEKQLKSHREKLEAMRKQRDSMTELMGKGNDKITVLKALIDRKKRSAAAG